MSGQSVLIDRIERVLDTMRGPIRSHNGDVTLKSYSDGIVYITLHGACVGCPISQITVKMGIEEALKAEIPEIVAVVATFAYDTTTKHEGDLA